MNDASSGSNSASEVIICSQLSVMTLPKRNVVSFTSHHTRSPNDAHAAIIQNYRSYRNRVRAQGKLLRNIGAGNHICADGVILVRLPRHDRSGAVDSRPYEASTHVDAPSEAIAFQTAEETVGAMQTAALIVASGRIAPANFISVGGHAVAFRRKGMPGAVMLDLPLVYQSDELSTEERNEIQVDVELVTTGLTTVEKANEKLAALWVCGESCRESTKRHIHEALGWAGCACAARRGRGKAV